jgi:signal transduction histidine kinase
LLVLNTFKSKNSIYLNLILLIFLGVIPIFTSEYLIHVLGYGGSWIATAAIMPIVPVLIYVLSLQRLTQKDRDLVIEKLLESAEVNQNSLPGEFELESASIASYLHNSLQSELLALSRQLELAAEKMDPVTSSKLMERISNRVNRNLAEDFQLFADSSFNRLDAVIESWKGILDITIDFPNNLTRESKKFPILVQTIEEVSSNISRYDFATKLRVTAECHDDSILLTFQSDGKGKLVKSRGSGSIWLNRVAISEWTIEKNHKGTQISIEI